MQTPYKLGKEKTVWSVGGVAPMEILSVPVTKTGERTMHWQYVKLNRNVPGAVAIAVHENKIAFVTEWRLPSNRFFKEIPRGRGSAGESTTHTAKRELAEETGLTPLKALKLGEIYPDSGTLSAPIGVAVISVQDAEGTGVSDGEVHYWEWIQTDEIDALIANGDIQDGISIAALQLWRAKGSPLAE